MQLNLKVLWDGHLARPNWAGRMPIPQLIRGFNRKVAHRVELLFRRLGLSRHRLLHLVGHRLLVWRRRLRRSLWRLL